MNELRTKPARSDAQTRPAFALASYRKELAIFVLLVVVSVIGQFYSHNKFFTVENLTNNALQIGLFGIFSLGMGFVIITGGIDLSVGSMFALEGVLLVLMLTQWHWPPIAALLACLALTSCLGLAHGLLITRMRLQPFIVTLCGLFLYRGLARFITQDNTVGFGVASGFEWLQKLTTEDVWNVPMPFIALVVLSIIMWVVLHRSVYGRHLYAVGRNEEASRYSGVNSLWVIAGAYIVSGILAGIAGIYIAFDGNSVEPSQHGQFYELYGIAAAVLGGCSLRGGEGSIIGIVLGMTLLQVLRNLVNLLGIPSSLEFAVVGTVILIGVIADELIKRRSAKSAI